MDEFRPKISFFSKNDISCPVCGQKFKREELLSGGGRMNAGDLTDELHRQYLPTNKYGDVYPLIYQVTVCPECFYAAFSSDFSKVSEEMCSVLLIHKNERFDAARNLIQSFDFAGYRRLEEGLLSYIFASMCYDLRDSDVCPIFKQALCTLRGAWLSLDLHKKYPADNYDYLANVFYRKARFFYSEVIIAEREHREDYEQVTHFGPDIDSNFGFDGVLLLAGLLEYKYGPRGDAEQRVKALNTAKITVSRIVGMGKSSKSKPSVFVDNARDLHTTIKDEISKLEGDFH